MLHVCVSLCINVYVDSCMLVMACVNMHAY